MPVESFLPMLVLRYVATFSQHVDINNDMLGFGFDPELVLKSYRPPSPKKQKLLKAIDSTFSEPEEGENKHAISIIVDENLFNTVILDFVIIDQSFSLRDAGKAKGGQEADAILEMLSTTTAGMIMPGLIEEYGEGKMIDMMVSLSHNLIQDKLPKVKPSGLQMDKNGNFKFTFNGYA